jgi:hypothetical protein
MRTVSEDYTKMRLGQLRRRIEAGDKDAEAYLSSQMKPIEETFRKLAASVKDIQIKMPPPAALDTSALEQGRNYVAELRAQERRAEAEREQAMVTAMRELLEVTKKSAEREIDGEAREQRMEQMTFWMVVFGAVAALSAIGALVLALT